MKSISAGTAIASRTPQASGPGGTRGFLWRMLAAGTAGLCLAACGKAPAPHAAPSPAVPSASPDAGFAGVSEPPVPTPMRKPAEAAVETPAEVNMNVADAENQLVKSEVLSRIDLMPKLTPEEKDKLYVQVDRARGMGRIVTIPFSSGKTSVAPAEIAALQQAVKLPQLQQFSDDPTVVFVVLGFADRKGDPDTNRRISLERADSVVAALKDRCGIMNLCHSVGMGSSEMFDARNLDKNRVVEVWAVLP